MLKKTLLQCFLLTTLAWTNTTYASPRYLLCGPDEDGCPPDGYQFCGAIPYDEVHGAEPYCLDFDKLTCTPISEAPDCNPRDIYQNQSSCVATIFQSEPEPPCPIKTEAFCLKHHTAFCGADGSPASCHPS